MRHGWATAAADGSFEFEGLLPGVYVLQSSQDSLHGMIRVDLQDPKVTSVELVLRTSGVADIVIEGPIELFDGLTMLRYSESSIEWPEFPLHAEVAGTNRWRMKVESGPIQIQAWRSTGPVGTDAPKKFFFDETLELEIGETRTLTLPSPR